MKFYIRAKIQQMAQAEMLEFIPKDTIERIKKSDASPEFRIYCVGHEGDAHAQELSFGTKIGKAFHYVKDMVMKIAEKIQFGTPIFHQHSGANTSDGREQVGEVVGKIVKTIGDRVSALAAIYLYPQYRKMQLDVASIEANIAYDPKSATRGEVIDVEQVTGIALANSATEKPAFQGATLLGVIQALRGAETMTKEEIKEAIREAKLKPTDLFEELEIVNSEPAAEARKKERAYGERQLKLLNEEHEKFIDLEKKHNEAVGKVKTLTEKVNSSTSRSLIDGSVAARKLDAKEKAFIEKNLSAFKSDKEGEDLKVDVERFVDGQLKEFVDTAKLFGVEIKKEGEAGTPNADGKGGASTPEELEDPAKNDFIPAM
jgi:hypothetical protein